MAVYKLYDSLLEELKKDKDIIFFIDLDSTIYDLSKRQLKIFREFASLEEHKKALPEEVEALANLGKEHMSFYPQDCIKNYSGKDVSDSFSDIFYPFWAERFFSNDYLIHDEAELGAKEFVHEVFEHGGHIHYLTGRDVARMGPGTLEQLKRDDFFPSGDECEQVKLVLKPEKSMNDAQFKHDHILKTLEQYHKGILLDNEPSNLQILKEKMDKLHLIHYDSYHMGNVEVPEEALVLESFAKWAEKNKK
jgi:hypothetical protein